MVYTLRFFSSKCSLFHNSNVFCSRIIHILYTGCAKIKKNNSGAKRLNVFENQYHISILKYQTTIFTASCEQKVFLQSLPSDHPPSVSSRLCSCRECGTRIFLCQVYCYRGIPFVNSCTFSFAIRMLCCSNIHFHEMKNRIGYLYTI